jgi:L-ascorbate metabolism protein UlaG (beta-lactamase superfamily)
VKIGRRALLAGGGTLIGATALEAASLRGTFDHRSAEATASEAWTAALGALGDASVVHVGHSTHLVCMAGVRMLTDPWFYDPAFGALSHAAGPAVMPEAIGELDAILVSHDHPDHADLRAMDRLDKRATVLVATSDLAARLRDRGFSNVHALVPNDAVTIGAVTITATEAVHDVTEIGFAIEHAGQCVYFAGDTRLFDGIAAIGERFHPRLAILPVDGTRIAGATLAVMTPDDAVIAATQLGARAVMSSHADAYFSDRLAGTFLATTVDGANARFAAAMARALPRVPCVTPRPGEMIAL